MIEVDDKIQLEVMEMLLRIRHHRIDFAMNHHRNTRGHKMSFSGHKHLLPLYNTLSRDIVIKGSTQSMKSEWAIIDLFSQAVCGLSVFFVLPKHDHKNSYVQNRIDKCIQQVNEYKKYLKSGFFDNTSLKHFGKGVIKFVGSNIRSDFREFPSDSIFVDEYDECSIPNLAYAADRVGGSPYQIKRYIANPTVKGFGIEELFEKSDMKEWYVKCQCGEYQELDWFKSIVDPVLDKDGVPVDYILRDVDFKPGRELRPICNVCGDPFDRFNEGAWLAQNPDSDCEGFHLTRMQSRLNSLASLYLDFQNCLGDTELMKHFWTSILGVGYSGWGMKVTKELLQKCSDDYHLHNKGKVWAIEDNEHPGPCTMGVDVGKFFDVRVSELLPDGRRKMVLTGKIPNKAELLDIAARYNVKYAVIDSMPEAKISQEFQQDAPFRVWLARYGSDGLDRVTKVDKKTKFITCDRTTILDKTFSDLKEGRNILPCNFDKVLDGEYLGEMMFSIREAATDAKGNTRFIWTKGKDHQRHADVYDYLAARMADSSSVPINISIV